MSSALHSGLAVEVGPRFPYRVVPPVIPDVAWLDGSPWYEEDPLADNFVLDGTTVTGWRNRGAWIAPATPGAGTASIDVVSKRYPVVSFPSSGENPLTLKTIPALTRPYSVFAVASATNFSALRSIIGSGSSGGFVWRINASGQFEVLNSSVAIRATSAFTVSAGTPFAAGVILDAATDITHYLPGQTPETDAYGGAISLNAGVVQIGADTAPTGAAPFSGWIGEVMIVGREMTSQEADDTLAYLQDKWGIS